MRLERGPVGDAAAALLGAAGPFAFAPWDVTPLAPLALAGLFALWLTVGPGRAGWRGWLFGLGFFGVGASWVRESFAFSDVPPAAAIALTVLFVAFLALYPALLGYLQARGSAALPWRVRALAVLPAGWVLSEWVRGWFLTGFPWLQVGYSQVDRPLGGLAPSFGVYGVSWAVALTAGLLLVWLRGGGRDRRVFGPVLVALWGLAWGLGRVEWTAPSGPARSVAVVQGNVAQDLKWQDEKRAQTLAHYLALTRSNWDADLIVWPETAVPDFAHRVQGFLRDLDAEARANGAGVLLGIPFKDPETGRYHNSVLALGEDPSLYHKRHLVPFGEFVPLVSVLGGLLDLLNAPMSDFSPGLRDQPALRVGGLRVGVSICYEDVFGEEVIDALPEADALVNVSNDAWFGDSIAPHQHLQMARMRAVETGRDLVRATNTGISALIDWHGTVTSRVPQFEAVVLRGEVTPRAGLTPYARFGNWPVIVGALITLAGARLRARGFSRTEKRRDRPESTGPI